MTNLDLFQTHEDTSILTHDEMDAIQMLGDVYGLLTRIVSDGPCRTQDLTEMASKIHDLQHAVMANAAARYYPDKYRIRGGTPPDDGEALMEPDITGKDISKAPVSGWDTTIWIEASELERAEEEGWPELWWDDGPPDDREVVQVQVSYKVVR